MYADACTLRNSGFLTTLRTCLGRNSPRCGLLCSRSLKTATGMMLGLQWRIPCPDSTPAPPSIHPSRVRGPSTWEDFAIVLGLLPLPSPLGTSKCLCLCLASTRLVKGLGWDWAAGGRPQLSLQNVSGGTRIKTSSLLKFPCAGQSDGHSIASLACGCQMHAGHYFETDQAYISLYWSKACRINVRWSASAWPLVSSGFVQFI